MKAGFGVSVIQGMEQAHEAMTTASSTNDPPSPLRVFAYEAQTDDGQRVSGTMEAVDAEQAMNRLRTMRVRVLELNLTAPRPSPAKTLRGEDFIAFNEQLAQLAKAGLPLEQGLRLIATDIRGRRLKTTIEQLATELEKGTPLDQAFEKHQDRFPPCTRGSSGPGCAAATCPACSWDWAGTWSSSSDSAPCCGERCLIRCSC